MPSVPYDWGCHFEWQANGLHRPAKRPEGVVGAPAPPPDLRWQWAALLFEAPVLARLDTLVIGSRLDADLSSPGCRIAFHGALRAPLPSAELSCLKPLNIYKRKVKKGVVDRVESGGGGGPLSLIGRSLFSRDTDLSLYVGMRVQALGGQVGVIDSPFGGAGKFRASFAQPGVAVGGAAAPPIKPGDALTLRLRKYMYAGEGRGTASLTF